MLEIRDNPNTNPRAGTLCEGPRCPLSLILRKVKFHYEFDDKETRINYFLFMDDLKLFAKSNDQNDSLVNTV